MRPTDYVLRNLLIDFYVESVPFSRTTIEGRTSLGGSESALLGLAKALARRGHDVHIFASKLELGPDDPQIYDGVQWHPAEGLPDTLRIVPPDVFCSLRMPGPFALRTGAGLNLLWNQDMLTDSLQVAGVLSQTDFLVYVSEYHRQQWERKDPAIIGGTPSWVTTNAIDFGLVPKWPEHAPINEDPLCECGCVQSLHTREGVCMAPARSGESFKVLPMREEPYCECVEYRPTETRKVRHPHKFAYISRPERGLGALLQMWPRIRQHLPDAELHVCRYESMYDGEGSAVKSMVMDYDRKLALVQEEVGGLVMAGQLSKPDLYDLLTSCSLLLYPGPKDFAETSCIALMESQACGCVPITSYKGAIPETLGAGAGVMIDGDSTSEAYQDSFVEAVVTLATRGPDTVETAAAEALFRDMQAAGRNYVFPKYSFDTMAESWEDFLVSQFEKRYSANKLRVMDNLLHWDHHVAGKLVAQDITEEIYQGPPQPGELERTGRALKAIEFCDRVISGADQTAEDYAARSMDTNLEAQVSERFGHVIAAMKALDPPPTKIIDMAAGNGSFALAVMRAFPGIQIALVDYSADVLKKAREAHEAAGFLGQCRYIVADLHERPEHIVDDQGFKLGGGDVLFCGEYLEHTAEPHLVVDWLESLVRPGGHIFITTPNGPLTEALHYTIPVKRGHTHHFSFRDMATMLQRKLEYSCEYLTAGDTPRGWPAGYWLVQWMRPKEDAGSFNFQFSPPDLPAEPIDHWHTILTTRPYQKVIAAILVGNNEEWMQKMLLSIYGICDEILLLDLGSMDQSLEMARRFPNVTIYTREDANLQWPDDGFSAARNFLLDKAIQDHGADWYFWIDTDEHIVNPNRLYKHLYCGGGPFHGFVIKQQHLMLDFDRFYDIPCRVFNTHRGVRFYGRIHEQPESEMDKGVFPSLDVPECDIVHYGYEQEPIRRQKLLHRNFPILKRELAEAKKAKDAGQEVRIREMAWVLYIRDLVTIAGYTGASNPSTLTPEHVRDLHGAITLFHRRGYADPHNRYHNLIWPNYQLALKWLGMGLEAEWAFGAQMPRLKRGVGRERFFALNVEECQRIIEHRTTKWLDGLRPPSYDTRPWDKAREPDVPAPAPATDIPMEAYGTEMIPPLPPDLHPDGRRKGKSKLRAAKNKIELVKT